MSVSWSWKPSTNNHETALPRFELICGDCGKTFSSTFPTKTCPRCFAESDGPYEPEDIA